MQQSRQASPRRPEEPASPPRRAAASPAARRASVAPPPRASAITTIEAAFRRALGETLPGWVFAPLRLFLAVTFIYAGVQKLTDPQFFNPHAVGYIGKQIQGFATGSPIHSLLINVALPHAQFWGGVIAYGELAIGLGALVGLLLRPAAFFGLLLSLMFFLSASWRVRPYFYGADIVFVFAWATMLLAGPLAGGWPSLDLWLVQWIERRTSPERRAQVASALALVLGAPVSAAPVAVVEGEAAPAPTPMRGRGATRAAQRGRYYVQAEVGRRQFIRGAVVGGGVMLVVSWLWGITHPADMTSGVTGGTGATGGAGSTGATTGSTSSGASGASGQIALVKDVPVNDAATFTIPSNGDPGVLVHLNSGSFVAFDATCTHAGCTVAYDPSSQMLLCPCHGAAFDPAHAAEVVQGPAPTPLTPVSVNVNQSTGAITLN